MLHLRPFSEVPDEFKRPVSLESLKNAIKIDRYTAIDQRLQAIVEESPIPPAWSDAWRHSMRGRNPFLSPREEMAEPEERLAVWQSVRDSGLLPEDAGFYMVADQVRFLAELHVGDKMIEIDRRIDALYAEYGFEEWRSEEDWDSHDFLQFEERCPAGWDRLYFEMLTRNGEHQSARLYRDERERFEERMQSGREFFYPPPPPTPERKKEPPPQWVSDFFEDVKRSGCIIYLQGSEATCSAAFAQREDHAEVCLSVAPAQLVGGSRVGKVVYRSFVLDIERLRDVFDETHNCYWDPFDRAATWFVTHVWMYGTYRGHKLIFRVLSTPDEDVEPDLLAIE